MNARCGLTPKLTTTILLITAFALGLNAQVPKVSKRGKLDEKLASELKTGKASDTVKVIIRSHDLGSLAGKLAAAQAKNVKGFRTFPGLAAELTLSQLATFTQDPSTDAISSDETVTGTATISGTEPATSSSVAAATSNGTEPVTSSSGAAAAFKMFGPAAAGTGIGVAVIDSGIARISDLGNVVYSIDFLQNTTGKHVDDYGHGTQVAGIVGSSGAASGPAKTYSGVAPSARLVDVRVLDGLGNGLTSTVIAAIDWVIANQNAQGNDGKPLNIRVINLSLGHLPYEGADSDPLSLECRKAVQAGIVVVAAAGNYGKDGSGNPVYGGIVTPGIEPSVVTVGAVTTWGTPSRADDVVASYSSRGPTIDNIIKPDLVAPGSRIVSDFAPKGYLISQNPQLQVGSAYMALSGTSMAAPIVSGTVAMMLSKVPSLTPNAIKAILMYTSEKRGSPLDWGAGYLNVVGAMELATSVNPAASVNRYWLTPMTSLPTYDLINGYGTPWGQTIVWGDSVYTGNSLNFNKSAWGLTIVWGETIVWSDTIVWGETIVWETDALLEEKNLSAQTIAWGTLDAQTIVWDETTDDSSAQ